MRTYLLSFVWILCIAGCNKNETNNLPNESGNPIVIGQIDSLYSNILEEPRKIWVHIPESASEGIIYPVLYLLDGPSHFSSVTGMIAQLSSSNGNTNLPEMIVVGIQNTDRSRDLTPTKVDIDFFTGDSIAFASGGGGNFLDFIEKELIPYVDQHYPAAPYRTFIGHSFGGLSVINALITRPYLFNNYIAIDPSLWWDNQSFLKLADSILSVKSFDDKALFVGVANTMSDDTDIHSVRNDTAKSSAHIRSILQFVNSLDNKDNGLLFEWKYYENDDHGSVPLIAEYDALRSLFQWHKFQAINEIFDPGSALSAEQVIELVKSHYRNISTHMGYEVLPQEGMINSMGYYFMNSDMMDRASAFFDLNIQLYPESTNVYDSKGDCLLAQGDTLKALESFKKALEVGDNNFTQRKIDMLTKEFEEQH